MALLWCSILFMNRLRWSRCLQCIFRDVYVCGCFFISAEIDSFHVANKFDANASSNTAHTYQQHRNMPRFSILRHQYCFLVVLNVRDYNVYESLCIRSHLHVCNHASSEYRCHFSIVCRFVSVYWTICFARNGSFFRIHMYPRLNSLGDVQKLDTFLSQLQNAFADSETMLCLASLPLFFSLFMLHATLILGLVFRLPATLLYAQIEIDFFLHFLPTIQWLALCKWIWLCLTVTFYLCSPSPHPHNHLLLFCNG